MCICVCAYVYIYIYMYRKNMHLDLVSGIKVCSPSASIFIYSCTYLDPRTCMIMHVYYAIPVPWFSKGMFTCRNR